jgi:hypothetical protein
MRLDQSTASYQSIKQYFARDPIPAKLRVDTLDDAEPREYVIDKRQPRIWKSLHAALLGMRALSAECLNEQGQILRRVEFEHHSDDDDAEPPAAAAMAIPTMPLPENEDARMLALFAQLLSNAYKDGAAAQRESSDNAFRMLVDLANSAIKRMESLERAWTRTVGIGVVPPAEGGGDKSGTDAGGIMQILQQFMQGQAMAQQAAAARAAAANGAVPDGADVEGEGAEE